MQANSVSFTTRSEVSGAALKLCYSRRYSTRRRMLGETGSSGQNEDAQSFGVNFFLFCMKITRK